MFQAEEYIFLCIISMHCRFSSNLIHLSVMLFHKAHDGGVMAVELSRVMGNAPQLITIGADKTLAIWDTISFKVSHSYFIFLSL